MKTYCLTLKLKSSICTPFHNDTIFGHLCWGIRYAYGENALIDFLEEYNEVPPVIVSNGYPSGYLAMPVLTPYMPRPELDIIKKLKQIKKIRFVNKNIFNNQLSIKILAETSIEKGYEKISITRERNSIDRINNTTQEGGLYSVKETWWKFQNETAHINIYILSTKDKEKINELFECAFWGGYGADASLGKGYIQIEDISETELSQTGNRAMALGNFIPNSNEIITEILGVPKVKFGKLGGDFVHKMNPFKKPVLMYPAGTTFKVNKAIKYTGRLIENIHSDKRIKHYAFAPVLFFDEKYEENYYD